MQKYMPLNRNTTILLLLALTLMACNNTTKPKSASTWFGGEIVNPKIDFVVLNQGRTVIDTIYLDENNIFKYELENPKAGIYSFNHREFQVFYLEPGDSLMLRLNTIEFDESLAYSGYGAEKNNLLMDLFLLNEEASDLVSGPFSNLSPEDFTLKMDSIQAARNNKLNAFFKKHNPSEQFKEVAQGTADYSIFSKKELYIATNAKREVYDESVAIPERFYDYRKAINLNNEALKDYYTYYRSIDYYLDNLAFSLYKEQGTYDRKSFLHAQYKIKVIDSLITNESLRNRFLRNSAGRYMLNGGTAEEKIKILNTFKASSSNPQDIAQISKITESTIRLTPGNKIPNMMLLTTENTVKDLHSVINRPTVLYFWSDVSASHYRKIHTRAADLHNKYPEYDFVGINLDSHFKKWLRIIKNSGYSMREEFMLDDNKDAETKLVLNSINKAMILDGEGTILNGNTNIFNLEIESNLLALINN